MDIPARDPVKNNVAALYIWSCNYYSWIWLGVPPSFISTGLYGNSTQLRVLSDRRVEGCKTPSSNDFMRLDRRQGWENRDPKQGQEETGQQEHQ